MKLVYPVIVIYKTTLEEAASYRTLLKPNGVKEFLVYDNSPADYEQQSVFPPGVTYVRDVTNSGLPKAYNLGAQQAVALGYRRVLLLDQDTRFSPGTWACYEAHADYPGITAPLVVTNMGQNFSPVRISGWVPRALSQAKGGEYSLFDCAVVNSGCCIPVELYKQAGGYREAVKLDFADFQFQLAVRKFHPKVLLLAHEPAVQDFSNDSSDKCKLLPRFLLFLESACHYDGGSFLLNMKHHGVVLRHSVALAVRTRSSLFLVNYLKNFLFKKRP